MAAFTPERIVIIKAMLDHPAYSFYYGGYVGGLAHSEERSEVPANKVVKDLLNEIDRLTTLIEDHYERCPSHRNDPV